MPPVADPDADLAAFSRGEMSALELRRRLGGAIYGEAPGLPSAPSFLLLLAPRAGREADLGGARTWLFPDAGRDGG